MTSWYRRFIALRLWLRVALATALPVMGWLWFSGSEAHEQWRLAQEMDQLRDLTQLGNAVGALVHELQEERGISSGFVSSGGGAFAGELEAQRQETDDALGGFTRVAGGISGGAVRGLRELPLAEMMTRTTKRLAGLEQLRAEVDDSRVTPEGILDRYTETIEQLLGLVSLMPTMEISPDVNRMACAYESLLLAKEHAGQERAVGTIGFVTGRFEPGLVQRFVALGAAQAGFLERFRHGATGEQVEWFDQVWLGASVGELERLRVIGVNSAWSGDTGDVDGGHWLETATSRIGLLKLVEDRVNADLADLAVQRAARAEQRFLLNLYILAAALAATILAAWVVLRDLEARRQTSEVIRTHEQLLNNFVRAATDGFALFDGDMRLVEINQASMRLIPAGRTKEDFIGKTLLELNPAIRGSDRHRAFERVVETGEPLVIDDLVLPPHLGGTRLSVKVFKVGDGIGIIHSDVTAQKAAEDHLRVLATTDPLTGAVNRRRFFEVGTEELHRAKRHGRELSVISLDIDHFKVINDTFGHGVGDRALKLLTESAQTVIRAYDTFGRLGGEEFSILLPETPRSVARSTAERLRERLSDLRIPTPTGSTSLTVSCGVSALESNDAVLDDILKRADRALYAAKADGRNVVWDSGQLAEIAE